MRRLALGCVLALAVLAVPAVAPGAISITSSTSVSKTVTLDGLDDTATLTTTLTITGGGPTGWKVTAWAPAPATGGRSLSQVYVPSEPSATCTGKNCVVPKPSGISWPVTLGTSSGGAVKIYNAAAASGTGTDVVSVPFDVDIDADTLTGSYTSTITVAVANGP